MTGIDAKIIFFCGVSGAVALFLGFYGIRNKDEINKSSNVYMSINLLMGGALMVIFLPLFIYLRFSAAGINKEVVYAGGTIWIAASLLACGIHGVLHKKQIKDKSFFTLSVGQLVGAIIMIIGALAMILKWGWPVN